MVPLPLLIVLFNIGFLIYLAFLATRFVRAMERIADKADPM